MLHKKRAETTGNVFGTYQIKLLEIAKGNLTAEKVDRNKWIAFSNHNTVTKIFQKVRKGKNMANAKYFLKRFAMALLTIFLVACLTFLLMNAVPGSPWLSEKTPSAATLAALNAKYGLDKQIGRAHV